MRGVSVFWLLIDTVHSNITTESEAILYNVIPNFSITTVQVYTSISLGLLAFLAVFSPD